MTRHHTLGRYLSVFVVAFWVSAFLLQSWSATFIQFRYELNQESIAAVFCINKDKPEMHCEGRCHLQKQLEADNDHKDEGHGATSEVQNIILAPIDLTMNELSIVVGFLSHVAKYEVSDYFTDLGAIFHPPRV